MRIPRIEIFDLHKSFGKLKVLEGFNLTMGDPGIIAILGPNGSGKTTLIKSILGMVMPTAGEIQIFGHSIKNQHAYREHIDYLPQIARFPENLRVREIIKMVKHLRKKPANDRELISFFELEDHMDKKLSQLSGGTRQKVNIVLSCMFDSPIMILDEPTAGLDPIAVLKLKDLLRRERAKGKLIIITTHIMSFVEELSDQLVFLLNGKVFVNEALTVLKKRFHNQSVEQIIASLMKGENGHPRPNNSNSHIKPQSVAYDQSM